MIQSRYAAGHVGYRNKSATRNAMIYASGLLNCTLADNRQIPSILLRFPDFIHELDHTAQQLPLVPPITSNGLHSALISLVSEDKSDR